MSAFVLDKKDIDTLTLATDAVLRMNKRYCASYVLHDDTINLLGKYAGDLHNIYRALYITNIKAVNGRYGEDEKTLPKYTRLNAWDIDRLNINKMREAIGKFGMYAYQIAEDPICGSPIYKAIYDIYKLLCMIVMDKMYDWDGNPA